MERRHADRSNDHPQESSQGLRGGHAIRHDGYFVPHSVYPPGYHCDPKQPLPFAGLASQKNHMSLYLMCNYADGEYELWFREAWTKTGKKLDMGKSCVRFETRGCATEGDRSGDQAYTKNEEVNQALRVGDPGRGRQTKGQGVAVKKAVAKKAVAQKTAARKTRNTAPTKKLGATKAAEQGKARQLKLRSAKSSETERERRRRGKWRCGERGHREIDKRRV